MLYSRSISPILCSKSLEFTNNCNFIPIGQLIPLTPSFHCPYTVVYFYNFEYFREIMYKRYPSVNDLFHLACLAGPSMLVQMVEFPYF